MDHPRSCQSGRCRTSPPKSTRLAAKRSAQRFHAPRTPPGKCCLLRVQLNGDAHLSNFVVFGSPERRMVFDINDFDSTNFTTLFGGTDSLKNLWHNLATMK